MGREPERGEDSSAGPAAGRPRQASEASLDGVGKVLSRCAVGYGFFDPDRVVDGGGSGRPLEEGS